MKGKETTTMIIRAENEALLLAEGRRRAGEELTDVKDLMRKMREGEVQFADSVYCFNNGVAAKKKPKELYPYLEKRCKHLAAAKAEWERKLNAELAILAGLVQEGKLGGGELDSRVGELVREWALNNVED
jgi:hypothetical protein